MRKAWLALLGLLIALGNACGDSGSDIASHEGILALIPDKPERRDAVWVVDYAALRELPLPGDAPDEDSLTSIQDLTLRTREHTRLHPHWLRADDSSTFTSALDARDTDASLRGNPTFGQLARALDDREGGIELLASVMSDVHQGPSIYGQLVDGRLDATRQAVVDAAFAVPLLVPYEAYAIAGGVVEGDPVTVFILIHCSTEAATENAGRFEERLASTRFWDGTPWSTFFAGWEIEANGTAVIATLQGFPRWEGPTLGDPLLFHE